MESPEMLLLKTSPAWTTRLLVKGVFTVADCGVVALPAARMVVKVTGTVSLVVAVFEAPPPDAWIEFDTKEVELPGTLTTMAKAVLPPPAIALELVQVTVRGGGPLLVVHENAPEVNVDDVGA